MVPMNPNVGMVAQRVMYFTWMNIHVLQGSKFEEDHQVFNNEVYKVLIIIRLTPVEIRNGFLSTYGCFSNLVQPMNGIEAGRC